MLSGGECELSSSTKAEETAKMDDDDLSSSLLGQVNALVVQPQLEQQQKLEQKVEKQEVDDEIVFLWTMKNGEKITDDVIVYPCKFEHNWHFIKCQVKIRIR